MGDSLLLEWRRFGRAAPGFRRRPAPAEDRPGRVASPGRSGAFLPPTSDRVPPNFRPARRWPPPKPLTGPGVAPRPIGRIGLTPPSVTTDKYGEPSPRVAPPSPDPGA